MNDDQIRSELERRATLMSSRPDWTRRELLPAVREAIDDRPQRVTTTALLSPRLGVMAVIAALLVLVVAVPRLTPQPPSSSGSPDPSPSASPNRVMSSSDFFAGWRSGELRGRTVLVEGSIGEGFTTAEGGRPPCLPPSPCTWGSLLGIDPGLAVRARHFAVRAEDEGQELDGPTWPWWSMPQISVSGTMAMSVDIDGRVIFEGLVRPSQDGIEWSLADVAAFDPASVRPDEALLVRGHVVSPNSGEFRSCPMYGNSKLEGLPSRYCANFDYLSGEGPDGERIEIQAGAIEEFGENEALYALSPRLYGRGCAGAPPCWFWDIVARIDELPMPEPTPAPTTAPTTSTLPITHVCAGDMSVGPVELYDNAGLIESCSVETVDWPGEPLVVSDASRGVVRAVYSDGCAGASEARLDIWARSALAWPGQPPYVLSVDLKSPRAPLGCRAEVVPVAIDITFMNAALAPMSLAKDVEAFLIADGRGIDSVEAADGEHLISLDIAADKSVYLEGEAVGVVSSLVSDTAAELTCPFGPIIRLEQLDGSLQFSPGPFLANCSPTRELRGGEVLAREFSSEGWGYSEPNPLEPYVRDSRLYLPPGTYRFSSIFRFGLGDIVNPERGDLEASVVVRVLPMPSRPTPTMEPDPTPSGLACIGDGMATVILDASGLVAACQHVEPEVIDDHGSGVIVTDVDGDQTRFRIQWRSTICTDAAWMNVSAGPAAAFFQISQSAECIDSAARIDAIEIVLSRPLEVHAARLVRN